MGIAQDLESEWNGLAEDRLPWEAYWREIARYVLPATQSFDTLLQNHRDSAIRSVVSIPVAAKRSKDIYDMTSLWAIERLTAGMISLKTPESQTWHDMGTDSFFGEEPTHDEDLALENLRNYLFKVRANPNSGFWAAHRSAVKSMCGFGDGWMFTEEEPGGGHRLPYRYSYAALPELYPAVDKNGQPNRMFRIERISAVQALQKFEGKIPPSVKRLAEDPTKKHTTVRVLHAVKPRDDSERAGKLGVRGGAFESHYTFPDESFHVGEGGYFEFPFIRYAWSNTGTRPFSEGPVAYALGELKSLQEMSKNELIATQVVLRPAYGTAGKNFVKLNFNPGATNPGLVTPEGAPLFQPLNTGVRPDFARVVLEARRESIREMLYLNLWQIVLQDKTDTATEALIRAQEKGELLGPVGISLNEGLAHMVDREVGILGRKRAFDDDSPLAMPDTLASAEVSPVFTSPLDRLRRMSEVVGMQRLVEFAMMLTGGDPQKAAEVMARFDIDEMLDKAQEILGAPVSVLKSREAAGAERDQTGRMQQMAGMLEMLKGGGEAAQAVGAGGTAVAQGAADVKAAPPELQQTLQNAPAIGRAAYAGARTA